MAPECGASNYLTAPRLRRYGFTQTKYDFRKGFALDVILRPTIRPLMVHVVKSLPYHLLSTLRMWGGGYTHMRHNKIRDNIKPMGVKVQPLIFCPEDL